ncbi:MAG: hypothetical protein M3Z18_00995 [Gemmatimonadota bacterium]|nr:hypothetical protein [Gemmatimonadota bacterium]
MAVASNSAVLARWQARQGEMAKLRAHVDAASLIDEFLGDLHALVADEQPVTLTKASGVTGYSPDHLSRLIRAGKLTDHGRKHAPRVKVSECPRKVSLAATASQSYNPDADARSLVGSRR